MVRQALEEVAPITCFPEPETFHLRVVITHRCVRIWCTMQIQVHELFQVCANDLICIDENNLLQVHWEQDVKEKDLVRPDDTLFFALRPEPGWPFVSHELVFEAVLFREVGYEFLATVKMSD